MNKIIQVHNDSGYVSKIKFIFEIYDLYKSETLQHITCALIIYIKNEQIVVGLWFDACPEN